MKTGQIDLFTRRVRRGPVARERDTHIAVADALRAGQAPGWWSSHIPAGELRTEQTGRLLKRMKTEPGMADFMLLGPGMVCFLELKRPGNKPTGPQIVFGVFAKAAKTHYAVAYSYDEAMAILKGWGAVRISL